MRGERREEETRETRVEGTKEEEEGDATVSIIRAPAQQHSPAPPPRPDDQSNRIAQMLVTFVRSQMNNLYLHITKILVVAGILAPLASVVATAEIIKMTA